MTEETTIPVEAQDNASGKSRDDMVSHKSYLKVLGEKKKRDQEVLELRDRLESIEQAKLEAEGNKDEVISNLKNKLSTVETEYKSFKEFTFMDKINSQIKSEAKEQGCVNPDKFLKLLGQDQISSLTITQTGDSFSVDKDDLLSLMEDAKKEHSDIGLFKPKKINVTDMPSGKGKFGDKPKSLENMSKEEILKELEKLN